MATKESIRNIGKGWMVQILDRVSGNRIWTLVENVERIGDDPFEFKISAIYYDPLFFTSCDNLMGTEEKIAFKGNDIINLPFDPKKKIVLERKNEQESSFPIEKLASLKEGDIVALKEAEGSMLLCTVLLVDEASDKSPLNHKFLASLNNGIFDTSYVKGDLLYFAGINVFDIIKCEQESGELGNTKDETNLPQEQEQE